MSSPGTTEIGQLADGGQPASPGLPIETLIEQLVKHASDVVEAQHRLGLFHTASRRVMGELELLRLLRLVVGQAREVIGVHHAALGVLNPDGCLQRMLVSSDDPTAADLRPPGALRAVRSHGCPLLVDRAVTEPARLGLDLPADASLLAVPVRHRDGGIFGTLFLSDRLNGRPFGLEDVELAEALAATAGFSIDNALAYARSCRRQEWLRAGAELSRFLVNGLDDRSGVLGYTADILTELVGADAALTLELDAEDPSALEVVTAVGSADGLSGLRLPAAAGVVARALGDGRPTQAGPDELAELAAAGLGSAHVAQAVAVPLADDGSPLAVVLLLRHTPFSASELELAEAFAGRASVAIRLAQERTDRQRLSGMEQRDQIARDLHTQVVQRLFAIGISLQGSLDRAPEPAVRARLRRSVEDIDDTIAQIRTSIFTVTSPTLDSRTVADTSRTVVAQLSTVLGFPPELELHGPLDWPANAPLLRDVEAVLREALTNVGKYAQASEVRVRVETDGSRLELTVADNGVGMDETTTRRSGLDNLRRRAERYGGSLVIDRTTEGGLRLLWAIPL